jgi:hypothetical protein
MRIARPDRQFGHQETRGRLVAVWKNTHRSLAANMRILDWNENSDLTRDLLALESEPISNPETFPAPESELLDHLAPDWQLRLHDGAVIDHILDVINTPRTPHRSHASLSNVRRRPRPGVREKTALTLPRPLYFSGPREFSSDQ